MPQTCAKKPTSLFGGLFQKKEASPAEPAALPEVLPSPADTLPPPPVEAPEAAEENYSYVSSWQKAMDEEEEVTEEMAVINAQSMTNALNSIFNAKEAEEEEIDETHEPKCVSSQAAERFALALHVGQDATTPKTTYEDALPSSPELLTTDAAPYEKSSIRFADRLRQQVETSLAQS